MASFVRHHPSRKLEVETGEKRLASEARGSPGTGVAFTALIRHGLVGTSRET